MIKEILRMGGCKTEKEFLKKYPTEESFLEAFPQARPMLEMYKSGGSLEAFPQARPMLEGYLPRFQAQKSIVGRIEDQIDAWGRSIGKSIANNPLLSEADVNKAGNAAGTQIQKTFTTYDPNKSTARNIADATLAIGTLGKLMPHPVAQNIGNLASLGESALAAYDVSQAMMGDDYGTAATKGAKALNPAFKSMSHSTNPLVKGAGVLGETWNKLYSRNTAVEKELQNKGDIKSAITSSFMPTMFGNPRTLSMPRSGFAKGGDIPAFPQQPTEGQFFDYSHLTPNIPRLFQTGGLAFPQAPSESRFFNYGPTTPNLPRLFQSGGMMEMASDEDETGQPVQDEDEMSAEQEQQPMQQQGKKNDLLSVIEELTADYNIDPNQMVAILQSLPQEMMEDLTSLASSDPESAASSLMEMYQSNSNQPLMAYGGVPTGQGLMEYKEEPMGTASEEYGGSVFNYGQFPAIMEKGGSAGMNKHDSFLSEKLQKFVGKLNENATIGKLKEAQEEMNAYYGFKKGGQKKNLPKHQFQRSIVGPREIPGSAGFVDMPSQMEPGDITAQSVRQANMNYSTGVPNQTFEDSFAGAGMYPGQGVLSPDVLNAMISSNTPAGKPYAGPPSLSAANTSQPLTVDQMRDQITGGNLFPKYSFTDDVNKYLEEKDKRAPSINAPGDEVTKTYDLDKKNFFDKQKDKWNKKTGIQKAESILNFTGRVVGAKEKMIEDERQQQVDDRLYNPANWASKYPVNRGKWDVNTAAFDPYNTAYGNSNMAEYGGEIPMAQSGLEVKMKAGLGFNANQLSWPVMAGEFSQPDVKVGGSLQPVDREDATLEAEDGETAMTDLAGIGIPQLYDIGGDKHSKGGTPLDLPDNSFIFSEFMKLKDKDQLAMFGVNKSKRGGVSFADISKKFKLNNHIKSLMSPESDELTRDTAQANIVNSNMKLGKLALIQESMKNFPDGIPLISLPYLNSVGITPDQLAESMPAGGKESDMGMPQQPLADNMARYGANVISKMRMKKMGGEDLPVAQGGKVVQTKARGYESSPGFFGFGASDQIKMIKDQFQQVAKSGDAHSMREFAKALRLQPSEYNWSGRKDEKGNKVGFDTSMYDIGFSPTTLGIGALISTLTGDTPYGLTEQDEVEDMADLLENSANDVEFEKAYYDIAKTNEARVNPVIEKRNKTVKEIQDLQKNPDNLSATELYKKLQDKKQELSNYETYLYATHRKSGYNLNQGYPNWSFKKENTIGQPIGEAQLSDAMNMSQGYLSKKLSSKLRYHFGENKENQFSNYVRNEFTVPEYTDWYNENKLEEEQKTGKQEVPVGPGDIAAPVRKMSMDTLKNWKSYTAAEKAKKAKESGYTENEISAEWWKTNQPNIATWISAVNEGRNTIDQVPAVYKSYVEKELNSAPVQQQQQTTPVKKRSNSGTSSPRATGYETREMTEEEKAAINPRRRTYSEEELQGATSLPIQRRGGPLDKFLTKFQKKGEFTQFPEQSYTGQDIPYYELQPKQDFGIFKTQAYDPNLGYYTVYDPKAKKNIPVDMEDFYNRQGELLANYDQGDTKGVEGFKKDLISKDKATRERAAGWFQDRYNKLRESYNLKPYFFDQEGPDPYGLDKKFGVYTFSAPGYKQKTGTPPPPGTPPGTPPPTEPPLERGPGLNTVPQQVGSPFWTEDIINTGAAFRNLGDINKYLPWQAVSPFYAAQPTFESAERALAAGEEALATGIQGASTFGNAQGFASAASSMAGNEAAQAANVIADVNNRNIQTANQFEMANKQAYNQYMQNQADRATDMYNKNVIANQQFDNSRREGRDELRKQFVNAWTNRGKTQNLNAMYSDQYYTDPRTGYTYMTNPKAFEYTEPTYDNMPDYLRKVYDQAMANKDYKTALDTYEIWKELVGKRTKEGDQESYMKARRNIKGVTDTES